MTGIGSGITARATWATRASTKWTWRAGSWAKTHCRPGVLSVGGRLGYEDDGQTPNTLIAFHDYPTAPLIMEVRGLPEKSGSKEMDNYKGAKVGVVIECEGGHVLVPDYDQAIAYDADGREIKRFAGVGQSL